MLQDIANIGLEGSIIIFFLTLTYKIYRMQIRSTSHCCGDAVEIETYNPGNETQIESMV